MSAPEQNFRESFDALIEGRCSDAQRERLEKMIEDHPELRAEYVTQMRVHAMLCWRSGAVGAQRPAVVNANMVSAARSGMSRWRWAAAAALIFIALAAAFWRYKGQTETIASLVESENVIWSQGAEPIASGARLKSGAVQIDSGRLKFVFDCGAVVNLDGPAIMKIIDGKTIGITSGKATARVEDKSAGFTIRTPSAEVLDLGTEFGVAVGDAQRTDVIVFEGKVKVTPTQPHAMEVTHLNQGDSARVDARGKVDRIEAVQRDLRDKNWSAGPSQNVMSVISDVHDNRSNAANRKSYQIVRGGMDEGALAFVDRNHRWRAVKGEDFPEELRGADLVMTYNDDKKVDMQIQVSVSRAARLYVLMDRRGAFPPGWLQASFRDTGQTIMIDEGRGMSHDFAVWEQAVPNQGVVVLGANTGLSMYGIAARFERTQD